MATSGTFTFRLTVDDMVTEAYERCGYRASQLTQYDAESARRSLNLMFTEWTVRGINYWTLEQDSITVTAGTSLYALDAGVLDIYSMVIRRDNSDTVMQRIGISDYNELPNKTQQGKPSSFMLDRQYTPQIYIWQTPDNSTDQLIYWQMKQLEDVTLANQDADVPYRWTEALCSGLAAKLAVKKRPELKPVLTPLAAEAFEQAATDERERASLRINPA